MSFELTALFSRDYIHRAGLVKDITAKKAPNCEKLAQAMKRAFTTITEDEVCSQLAYYTREDANVIPV